jgi:hypothetical protein
MASKRRFFALLVLAGIAAAIPGRAAFADPVTGDACTGAGNYTASSGPELSGAGHLMVCSGSVWKSVVHFDATANGTLPYALNLSGDITPTALAANTNDWAPTGLATASVIRMAASAAHNLIGRPAVLMAALPHHQPSSVRSEYMMQSDQPRAIRRAGNREHHASSTRSRLAG